MEGEKRVTIERKRKRWMFVSLLIHPFSGSNREWERERKKKERERERKRKNIE